MPTAVIKYKPWIMGIDPGKSGGIACLSLDGKKQEVFKMPDTLTDLHSIFTGMKPTFTILEKVWSMPGEGHAGAFTFGEGFGALKMGLVACKLPHEILTPSKWIKYMSIPNRKRTEERRDWKNRLKAEAQQLFPNLKVTLWSSDALLIAECARRKYAQTH